MCLLYITEAYVNIAVTAYADPKNTELCFRAGIGYGAC